MGANHADFHGIEFSHRIDKKGQARISALHPDYGHLGFFIVGSDGTIGNVYVHPAHTRKGIATGMYNYAKQLGLDVKHSENRTQSGDAWAKSTGDPLPENKGVSDFDERVLGN